MFDTKKAFCLQNTWRQWFGVNLLNKISSNKKRRRNEVFEIPLEEDNLEYPKNMAHGSQWRCLFPRLFKWKIAVAESHTRKSTNQRHRDKLVDILKHKSNMANKKGTPPRKLTWIPKKWWLGWNGDSLEQKGHFWYLRGQISGVTNHQTTTAGWSFIRQKWRTRNFVGPSGAVHHEVLKDISSWCVRWVRQDGIVRWWRTGFVYGEVFPLIRNNRFPIALLCLAASHSA